MGATTVSIKDYTRSKAPGVAFSTIAEDVLPGWEISLAFVGRTRAQALNKSLRSKDYTPNVLSYVVGKKSGEIIICLEVAKRQAPEHELSYRDFVTFLFIHGLYHLKGMRHGGTMDRIERETLARFTRTQHTHGTTHRNRH